MWQSSDLLDRLEDLREDLNHNDFADDVPGAKKGRYFYRTSSVSSPKGGHDTIEKPLT